MTLTAEEQGHLALDQGFSNLSALMIFLACLLRQAPRPYFGPVI